MVRRPVTLVTRARALTLLAFVLPLAGLVQPPAGARAATLSPYAAAVLADAPAGYWRLGEAKGPTAADATGAHPGTYRNGPSLGRASLLPADATTTAVRFDGVNDDVRIPAAAALSPTASISLEAWIRPRSLPASGAFASVVTKRESWSLQFNGPRLELTIIQAGVRRRLQAPSGAVVAGRTAHVVGTFGGGVQRLYVDGVQVASAALAGGISATGDDVTIASWGGTQERFDGTIDEVAVYPTALTASRVAAHTSAGRSGTTPTPSPTPAPTSTPSPTPSPSASPSSSPVPSPTRTPSPTASALPTPAASPSASSTPRPSPTSSASTAPTPTPIVSPSPSLQTGLALHFMWQSLAETTADLDRMQAAGMTYARFDVSWRNSEPSKGSYRYLDKLDSIVAAIRAHGMALTITVIETPDWANGGAGMFAPPTNMADYASFTGMLAARYAAVPGMTWEVWNEENDPHFWTTGPSAAGYASMLKAAAAAIRAGDPDATVLTGGILFNDTGFLEGLYAAGAGSAFDGLAIHPYTVNRAPSDTSSPYYSYATSVPQFRAVLGAHGQSAKPVFVTEFGWSTANVSDATRATWFTDAVRIARSWTGVPALGAYTLHQSQFPEYGLASGSTSAGPTASRPAAAIATSTSSTTWCAPSPGAGSG